VMHRLASSALPRRAFAAATIPDSEAASPDHPERPTGGWYRKLSPLRFGTADRVRAADLGQAPAPLADSPRAGISAGPTGPWASRACCGPSARAGRPAHAASSAAELPREYASSPRR
jgi:hypothetical protein